MANHGKSPRIGARAARHYGKKSRTERRKDREMDRAKILSAGATGPDRIAASEARMENLRARIRQNPPPDEKTKIDAMIHAERELIETIKIEITTAKGLQAKLDGYKETTL